MIISSPIFEAYLKCPSKCWFLYFGKEGDTNLYSDFVRNKSNAYRSAGIERLMVKIQPSDYVVTPSLPVNIKTAIWLSVYIQYTYRPVDSGIQASGIFGRYSPFFMIISRNIFSKKYLTNF